MAVLLASLAGQACAALHLSLDDHPLSPGERAATQLLLDEALAALPPRMLQQLDRQIRVRWSEHLPEQAYGRAGGNLIDSPGIREFGLWHIDEEELLRGYVDLAPLAGHCRFRNCSHRHEPGCALIEAAESGAISQERLDNFFRIADTLDEDARQRYE